MKTGWSSASCNCARN